MRRRNEFLSIGLSAAIALMLFAQFMSRAEISEPPEKAPNARPPAKTETQITVAAITLPPPPEAKAPAQSAPEVAAAQIKPLMPSPAQTEPNEPTAVEPLRRAEAMRAAPPEPIAVQPLRSSRKAPSQPKGPVTPLAAEDINEEPLPVDPMSVDDPIPVRNQTPDSTPQPTDTLQAEPVVGTEEAKPLIAMGRPLLRLLEHGDGPRIDIAWPEGAGARERLFRSFARCYGMVVALMGPNGDLYSDRSDTAPWPINLDRFSGFVRQSGRLGTSGERAWSLEILRRHPVAAGAATVRVFPRAMDALLIGGLHKLLGDGYGSTKSIDARYVQRGDAVVIDNIMANGLPVRGRIDLSHAAGRQCRSRAPKGV